jgi:hypothetical protein
VGNRLVEDRSQSTVRLAQLDQNLGFTIDSQTKATAIEQYNTWLAWDKHTDFNAEPYAHLFQSVQTTAVPGQLDDTSLLVATEEAKRDDLGYIIASNHFPAAPIETEFQYLLYTHRRAL